MFTDTHAHLDKEYYDDISKIVEEAKNNNIDRIIVSGTNTKTNKEVLDLVSKYDNLYGSLGIHPEEVENYSLSDIDYIKKNINKKIIAIGEIGLDFYYSKENKDNQIDLFNIQLKLAEDLNLPVIIHSREATLETINQLKKYNLKGIIHSFSGSYETAKIYTSMGYLIGINGVITFKNSNIKEQIKKIPVENIVLETDSPYLTPSPFRGKVNEPKYLLETAKFVADLYGISLEKLAKITNENINDSVKSF
jgi:TatD DNase family protein